MDLLFTKWQGAGNDFILIEDFDRTFYQNSEYIRHLCHRRLGIGADGLILIQKGDKAAVKMVYFNNDGKEAFMCGNGLRCLFMHAFQKGYVGSQDSIETAKGAYSCQVEDDQVIIDFGKPFFLGEEVLVSADAKGYWIDSGVPHFVIHVEDIKAVDVAKEGEKWRYHPQFGPGGVNVNFVAIRDSASLFIRTYERGVEAETPACGTGVVAAAFAAHNAWGMSKKLSLFTLLQDELIVEFDAYGHCHLQGAAVKVFEGNASVFSLYR